MRIKYDSRVGRVEGEIVQNWRTTFQPRPLRALNQFLERRGTTARQREAFTPESLMEAATRATGLSDFGDPHFLEPLRLICDDLRANPDLHSVGWYFARDALTGSLVTRLKIADFEARMPAIFEQPVRRPLIVLGLPRTGTTRLMRILAEDPANRPLRMWEAFTPAPPPVEGRTRFDRRRLLMLGFVAAYKWLVPGIETIHAMGADLPEECVLLMCNSFDSWFIVLQRDLPTYQKWFLTAKHEQTYAEHRKQLQLLQWHVRRERWLLKSPGHMFAPAELLATYPDALIIQTHRDPARVIPSIASLASAFRGMTVSRLDDARIGGQILEQMDVGLHRLQSYVPQIPSSQRIDVQYEEIVRDPMGVVTRIYDHFGLELSIATRRAFEQEIARNPKDKKGKHVYTLEQFGLSREQIDGRFSDYIRANEIQID